MSTTLAEPSFRREPELLGQTVVVVGGSAGIGLETVRRARSEGAAVVLAAPPPRWTGNSPRFRSVDCRGADTARR